MNLLACIMCKDEPKYLLDNIEYHSLIGIEHFIVYDNKSQIPLKEVLSDKTNVTVNFWNDKDNGVLNIGTYVGDRNLAGQQTSWRITNLPNANEAVVICDGATISDVEIVDGNTIRVPTDIGQHQYQIYTGYFGQELAVTRPDSMSVANAATVAATKRTAEQNARAAESVIASGAAQCPCCPSV